MIICEVDEQTDGWIEADFTVKDEKFSFLCVQVEVISKSTGRRKNLHSLEKKRAICVMGNKT